MTFLCSIPVTLVIILNLFCYNTTSPFQKITSRNDTGDFLLRSRGGHTRFIVGGSDAAPGEFPWQISIQEAGYPICGGAIVNERKIVTAAHCLQNIQPHEITIVAGAYSVFNPDGTEQHVSVSSFTPHPDFNDQTYDNDVAVLTLSSPLTYNSRISVIPIAASGIEPSGSCIAVGWGNIRNDGGTEYPEYLQKVNLGIVERSICESLLEDINPLTAGMICARSPSKGTCNGDSGSGFICRNNAGKYYLAGVVSWGEYDPHCVFNPDFPSVFTNIAHYATWIQSNLQ